MPRRTPIVFGIAGGLAVAGVLYTALPLLAADRVSTTVNAVADTTQTQVAQDGDNSVRTTLATCPQSCETNADGWRDATIEVAVTGLPAGASKITAKLQVYTWAAATATVSAHLAANGTARLPGVVAQRPAVGPALGTLTKLVSGYNDFDVSAAVTGNGTYTFVLRQDAPATRTYWASVENAKAAARPRLSLSYQNGSAPSPSVPASPTVSPTPSHTTAPPASPSPSPSHSAPGSTPPPSPTPTSAPAGWRLVWNDEFNGTTLDKTKWNTRNSRVDYDKACITDRPQNLFEGNGYLTLRALRETYTCGPETRPYTTTYVDTIGKYTWTYGRFEVRAKSPNGPTNSTGLWPAFWLRPQDGGNGEIDVTELPGGAAYYKAATQAIFHDYTPTKQDQRWTFPTGYPGDGFHVYTTEWSSTAMVWYIDGVEVYRRTPATTPWYTEVFNKPYNLRMNFQAGGWLGDPTAATTFPADFQVDYVRVYQH
jgi:beta-glucanase (GH16 family)